MGVVQTLDIGNYSDDLMLNLGRSNFPGELLCIDIYREELGLDASTTAFVEVGYSSFPLANRPVYTHTVGGKMGYSSKSDDEIRKTAQAVIDIMNQYPRGKGLILPFTDKLEKSVVDAIEWISPENYARLVQHDKNSRSRNQVFTDFDSSVGNDVLISTLPIKDTMARP